MTAKQYLKEQLLNEADYISFPNNAEMKFGLKAFQADKGIGDLAYTRPGEEKKVFFKNDASKRMAQKILDDLRDELQKKIFGQK